MRISQMLMMVSDLYYRTKSHFQSQPWLDLQVVRILTLDITHFNNDDNTITGKRQRRKRYCSNVSEKTMWPNGKESLVSKIEARNYWNQSEEMM